MVSKKKLTMALTGLLTLAILVGTWAFFTSSTSIDNEMVTKDSGGFKTEEVFTPKTELKPGAKVDKQVGVKNDGETTLVARIKLDEKWLREKVAFKTIAYDNDALYSVAFTAPSTYFATQADPADGLVPTDDTDESVVYKHLNLDKWIDGGDGYFYYYKPLAPGDRSEKNFMEGVTLASNADMGKYNSGNYYSTTAKDVINKIIADGEAAGKTSEEIDAELEVAYAWTATKPADETTINYLKADNVLDPDAKGYAKAQYTLTVTTEVCQATEEAVKAEWKMSDSDELKQILSDWALPNND